MRGIEDAAFVECTPVQEKTLALTLAGKDVAVQSQTGTGKTAAFLISLFNLRLKDDRFKERASLVIAPTRELAVQIEDEAKLLGGHTGVKIGTFYGGVGYAKQEQQLAEGVDLIIGTPGRLIDFAKQRKLDLSRVGIVVIDEADRLFDMGFYGDIVWLLQRTPAVDQRVTMLFSATLGTRVQNIAWRHMNAPQSIEIEPEQVTVDLINQRLYHVASEEKLPVLLGLLKQENPSSALIFTNTKRMAEELAKRLSINGLPSTFIMGDLPQSKRLRIITDMKEGKTRFLVATDVAARGLHIDDLDYVINYDLPEDPENYVHRIGRTARAGKTGTAVSLACERFVYGLEAIEEFIGRKIPTDSVSDSLMETDESAGQRISVGRDSRSGGRPDSRGRSSGGRDSRGRSRDQSRSRSPDRQMSAADGGQDRDQLNEQENQSEGGRTESPARAGRSGGGSQRGRGSARMPVDPSVQARVRAAAGLGDDDESAGGGRKNPGSGGDSRSGGAGRGRGGGSERGGNRSRRPRSGDQPESRGRRESAGVPEGGPPPAGGLDDRVAYYRKKYGEDFVVKDADFDTSREAPVKRGDSGASKRSGDSGGKGRKPDHADSPARAAKADQSERPGKPQERKGGFFRRLFGGGDG